MIERFIFGEPIETDALLKKPQPAQWQNARLMLERGEFVTRLSDGEIVYGLGQNVRGINKRGWRYVSDCTDDSQHTESKQSLYGAHNFLILDGGSAMGVFIDTPARVIFDIGYSRYDELRIIPQTEDFECYLISGDSPDDIVHQFRELVGRSYIPPRWAFGYGQSRWGYRSADEIREVVRKYRENDIPLDAVYLDIDYMERYKDFTVNRETFPDFKDFVREMRGEDIHLVPIIDGGVKKEEGYEVYEEGRENGYFCKDAEGEDFVIGVWPGKCCFPDMLNEDARKWFGQKYKILLDQGIEGFWNDMNEPAIFYSEKRLQKVFEKIEDYRSENLDINTLFEFKDLVANVSNNQEDYASQGRT